MVAKAEDEAHAGDKRRGHNGQQAWNAKRTKQDDEPKHILEKGHLFFAYRPKSDAEEVKGANDVQKFYILMMPDNGKPAKTSKASAAKSPKSPQQAASPKSPAKAESSRNSAASPKAEATKSPKAKSSTPAKSDQSSKVPPVHQPASVKTAPSEIKDETSANAQHAKHRVIIVASKKLPTTTNRSLCYAFVEDASDDIVDLMHKHLDEYSYETKTRGTRTNHTARVFGEARYDLIKQGDSSVHLLYKLETPNEATAVQKAFNIATEGSFVCQLRNPHMSNSSSSSGRQVSLGPGKQAHFPDSIQKHAFVGKIKPEIKFAPLVPDALNYQYAELLLIGVGWALRDEYGAIVDELEKEVIGEVDGLDEHHREMRMMSELKTSPEKHPVAATHFE